MLFGTPDEFGLEAVVEPGPDFPPLVGSSLAGRTRLFIRGIIVGDFDKPCCVLGPLTNHLVQVSSADSRSWHTCLSGISAPKQFEILDGLFYLGTYQNLAAKEALADCGFLTNESEAFDGVKGFTVHPPGQTTMRILLRQDDGTSHWFDIERSVVANVAQKFSAWWSNEEKKVRNQIA